MRFIELTKVESNRDAMRGGDDDFSATDDVNEPQQAAAPAASTEPAPAKVMVNAESIRCFYPRKNNQPGTRLTFIDGGGFPVEEDYATVKGMLQPN